MKAVIFSLFAIVSALITMSEARLGRSTKPNVTDKPTSYYPKTTAEEIHQAILRDWASKYHVIAELAYADYQRITTEFLRSINNPRKEINLTNVDIHIPDLRLTGMEVAHRIYEVRGMNFKHEALADSLTLSMMVPKITATFDSKVCQSPPKPKYPCTLVYFLENMVVDLKTVWPFAKHPPTIASASISKFDLDSIKSQVTVGGHNLEMQSTPKGSQAWNQIINMIHVMMPNPSISRRLSTELAQRLIT